MAQSPKKEKIEEIVNKFNNWFNVTLKEIIFNLFRFCQVEKYSRKEVALKFKNKIYFNTLMKHYNLAMKRQINEEQIEKDFKEYILKITKKRKDAKKFLETIKIDI